MRSFIQNLFSTSATFQIDPDYATSPTPKVLWIELTSKCPFDCVFCTRRVRFGAGQNLDFQIFQGLIRELESPDFIGLNYSGESIYYPQLLEAIQLATATGAYTELVTAFSTISKQLLQGIVESGLDRLAVSLHTMDPVQYQQIYDFGSLDLLKQRVDDFLEIKAKRGLRKPRLDFCFVAMSQNLDQLLPVAEYARQNGVPELSIHPIIGRHLVPHDFSKELTQNRLRPDFKSALRDAISCVERACPGLAIHVINPDLDQIQRLTTEPGYFAPSLPANGRIYSCDQSPFDSVHILASANVVVCEVHDETHLGNLREKSLREIWHSDAYREFRDQYVRGRVAQCRDCVWKMAYIPTNWKSSIAVADGMSPQLIRGWYNHEGKSPLWSKQGALVALAHRSGARRLRVAGILPHHPHNGLNTLHVHCNRSFIGEIRNCTSEFLPFDAVLPLETAADVLNIEFATASLFRPSLYAQSTDTRDIGFGLHLIEVCP